MRQFIIKISLFIAVVVAVNSLAGWIRMNSGDTITYTLNYRKKFINENQYKGIRDTQIILPVGSMRYDMSKEVFDQVLYKRFDDIGFSNRENNDSPDILLIGDSFFDDPYLSTDSGFQARINAHFKKNIALNIGAMGCSGLGVFQELRRQGYFKSVPKLVFMEVIERNASNIFVNLKDQIKHPVPFEYNNCFLDFALGNNLAKLSNSSLFAKKSAETYGCSYEVEGRKVWFYRNTLTNEYLQNMDKILDNLKACQTYFSSMGSRVVFIVAPDKESVYKDLFPGSHLSLLNQKMQERGIEHIDIYGKLLSQTHPESYYFLGDTHWNRKAIELVIAEMVKFYH